MFVKHPIKRTHCFRFRVTMILLFWSACTDNAAASISNEILYVHPHHHVILFGSISDKTRLLTITKFIAILLRHKHEVIILILGLFEHHHFEHANRTNDIQSRSHFALGNTETFVQFETLWRRHFKLQQ